MNKQNFNQSGGFPLQTETLDQMQKAYELFNSLGSIAGNFSIISGCVTTGELVSHGVVFINGEVLEFRGGQLGDDVKIVEVITAQEFEDGNDKDVVYIRYATFGIGGTSYPWINFKYPKNTIQLTEEKAEKIALELLLDRIEVLEARPVSNVPIGMIAIWDRPANEIPNGWVEYQALRGRMPIGHDVNYTQGLDLINYGLDNLGNGSGFREHKLKISELPRHRLKLDTRVPVNSTDSDRGFDSSSFSTDTPVDAFTEYIGDDEAHTNMSPYRVVHFIKYVG
jgi:hypothetical protein